MHTAVTTMQVSASPTWATRRSPQARTPRIGGVPGRGGRRRRARTLVRVVRCENHATTAGAWSPTRAAGLRAHRPNGRRQAACSVTSGPRGRGSGFVTATPLVLLRSERDRAGRHCRIAKASGSGRSGRLRSDTSAQADARCLRRSSSTWSVLTLQLMSPVSPSVTRAPVN